ncbi:hypothetical protein TDB9533_00075 [Thalassocella blandensis]|nr:hypothetical protein TDB9533_00075 [Thalassocella blandensis]
MRILFVFFLLMPIIEIYVLLKVGGVIGVFNTVILVVLTAIIGVMLLKQQGISTLARAQQKMQSGALPAKEMVEGIFLAVGGALLLTPGFVTDTIGFCCLIPGVRQLILGWGLKNIQFKAVNTAYTYQQSRRDGTDSVIEGEYERENSPENRK